MAHQQRVAIEPWPRISGIFSVSVSPYRDGLIAVSHAHFWPLSLSAVPRTRRMIDVRHNAACRANTGASTAEVIAVAVVSTTSNRTDVARSEHGRDSVIALMVNSYPRDESSEAERLTRSTEILPEHVCSVVIFDGLTSRHDLVHHPVRTQPHPNSVHTQEGCIELNGHCRKRHRLRWR